MSNNINKYTLIIIYSISIASCITFFSITKLYAFELEISELNFYEPNRIPDRPQNKAGQAEESPANTIVVTRHNEPISLFVSDNVVSFGTVTPGEPFLRSFEVGLLSYGKNGVQIFASEDHSPTSALPEQMPDTRCDDGNCSQNVASIWKSPLSYGFGFGCKKVIGEASCANDFMQESTFRQFANTSSKETPVSIIAAEKQISESRLELTYKINLASTHQSKAFKNTTTIIALPQL